MEMIKETAKVVRQQQIDEGIFDMELSFPKGAALAKPGQFIAMYCNDKSKLLPRPISICGINKEEGTLRVVYRVAGEGTKEFSEMKEGDTLEVMGPLGNGFALKEEKAIIIGGGIGIPPMLELAKQLNVLLSQLGVAPSNIVMNVGTAAVGYGFEYVVSTMDRVKAAALGQADAQLQMPIITPVADEAWNVKEAMASEDDMPEWGNQEERGIGMEVSTAASVLACGSNAVILKHPTSVATISKLIKEMM